jgi:hypothetical protein
MEILEALWEKEEHGLMTKAISKNSKKFEQHQKLLQ